MMTIEKEEAVRALDAIEEAQGRGRAVSAYRDTAPHLILWGAVWLIANSVTEFSLLAGLIAWPVLTGIAAVSSNQMAKRLRRRRAGGPEMLAERMLDWRVGASFSLLFVFVVTTAFVFEASYRQLSSFISLIAAFAYMAAGVWLGTRLLVIGAIAAVLILGGYFGLHEYYFLWLGIVGGSALICGGLWLQRV
jgi:hypothetical protein